MKRKPITNINGRAKKPKISSQKIEFEIIPGDVALAKVLCLEFKRIQKDPALKVLDILKEILSVIRDIFKIKPETVLETDLESNLIKFLIITLNGKADDSGYLIKDMDVELLKLKEKLQELPQLQQASICRAVSRQEVFLKDALNYVDRPEPIEEERIEENSESKPKIKRPTLG